MDHRSPTAEATLLSPCGDLPDMDLLEQDTTELLEDYGEVVQSFERINDHYYLFSCETVKVLLALVPESLPLEGFLDVQRPAAASIRDTEILDRLTQATSNITVIVVPTEPDAGAGPPFNPMLLRNICWDMVEVLKAATNPSLIFWAEDDLLLSSEEFERASLLNATTAETAPDPSDRPSEPVRPTPAPAALFDSDPEVSEEVRAWFEGNSDTARPKDRAKTRPKDQPETPSQAPAILQQIAALIPFKVTEDVDSTERRSTMQRFSMAATSATVSLTAVPKVANIFL